MKVRPETRRKQTQVLKMNIRTARRSIVQLESKGRLEDARKLRGLVAEATFELARRGEKA